MDRAGQEDLEPFCPSVGHGPSHSTLTPCFLRKLENSTAKVASHSDTVTPMPCAQQASQSRKCLDPSPPHKPGFLSPAMPQARSRDVGEREMCPFDPHCAALTPLPPTSQAGSAALRCNVHKKKAQRTCPPTSILGRSKQMEPREQALEDAGRKVEGPMKSVLPKVPGEVCLSDAHFDPRCSGYVEIQLSLGRGVLIQ